MSRSSRAAGMALVACLLASSPAVTAEPDLVRCDDGDDLQSVIDLAPAGARVSVSGTCLGTYAIADDLTLVGWGANASLDAGGSGVTLTIEQPLDDAVDDPPSVDVTGLAIRGGATGLLVDGGAMVTMRAVTIERNPGSGIVLAGSSELRGLDVTVTANGGHGVENLGSRAYLSRSVISHNDGHGIAAFEQAETSTLGTSVSDNHGRGLWSENSSLTLADSRVAMNAEGGIYSDGRAYLVVTDSHVTGNTAGVAGGGVYLGMPVDLIDGGASLDHVSVVDNVSFGLGGGIFIEAGLRAVNFDDVSIRDNRAAVVGGGIHSVTDRSIGTGVSLAGNEPDECSGCLSAPYSAPTAVD